MKPQDEKTYFVFGERVADEYLNVGMKAALKHAKKHGDFTTYVHDLTMPVQELLDTFLGWGGFATITKKEYLQFNEIIKSN